VAKQIILNVYNMEGCVYYLSKYVLLPAKFLPLSARVACNIKWFTAFAILFAKNKEDKIFK